MTPAEDWQPIDDWAPIAQAPAVNTAADSAARGLPPLNPAPRRTGYGGQVADALSGASAPGPLRGPTAAELGQQYTDLGRGAAVGVPASAVGAPGDVEGLLRRLAAGVSLPVSRDTVLPTSEAVGNAIGGPARSPEETMGRILGGFVGPSAALKGLGLAGRVGKVGYGATARPYTQATTAGQDLARSVFADAQPTLPPPRLANPSPADLQGASNSVSDATDAFGAGAHPPAAMSAFRDFLDQLKGHLESARNAEAAPFYNAFRAEPPLPITEPMTDAARAAEMQKRWPLNLPAVGPASKRAATNMLNDTGGNRAANNPYGSPYAKVGWTDFNAAGDPVYKTTATPTPDLLDRTKRQLSIGAKQSSMKADADTAASKTNAAAQMTEFLKKQYPGTYPAALDAYAKGSVPLAPFEHPDVAATLTKNESVNGTDLGYIKGDAELMNHIGASASPGETVQAFIDAVGDKKAAIQPLQEAIVGHLREAPGVIDPVTGEVNAKKLDQATRKYMPTISMYFPDLGRKFGTAKAAQATLDNMRAQEGLASNIAGGGLRNSEGVITPQSFSRWVAQNEKALASTQPGVVSYLKSIGAALKESPFGAADNAGNIPAAAANAATHGLTRGMFKGPQKARDAYSVAIEKAILDPMEARRLGTAAARAPMGAKWKALTGVLTVAPAANSRQ